MLRGFLEWVRTEIATILTLGGLVCLTTVVAMASSRLAGLDSRLTQVLTHKDPTMQTLTQTVTRSDGSQITVATVRGTDPDGSPEGLAAWIARHDAAVAAVKD